MISFITFFRSLNSKVIVMKKYLIVCVILPSLYAEQCIEIPPQEVSKIKATQRSLVAQMKSSLITNFATWEELKRLKKEKEDLAQIKVDPRIFSIQDAPPQDWKTLLSQRDEYHQKEFDKKHNRPVFYVPLSQELKKKLKETGEWIFKSNETGLFTRQDMIRYKDEKEKYAYFFIGPDNHDQEYYTQVQAIIEPDSSWVSSLFHNVARAEIRTIHTIPATQGENQWVIKTTPSCLIWGPLTSEEKKRCAAAVFVSLATVCGVYVLLKNNS